MYTHIQHTVEISKERYDPNFHFSFVKFPNEFKKNWLATFDKRYLCILGITFFLSFGFVLLFQGRLPNRQDISTVRDLHTQYVEFLMDKDTNNSYDKIFQRRNTETYLYGVAEPVDVPFSDTQTQNNELTIVASITPSPIGKSVSNAISIPLLSQQSINITSDDRTRQNKINSIGLLQLLEANTELRDNLSSDIESIERESSSKLLASTTDLFMANKENYDLIAESNYSANYQLRGTNLEKVSFKNIINSLSPKEEIEYQSDVIKNENFDTIESSQLVTTNRNINQGYARSAEEVTRVILSHNQAIQDCYKQSLKKNPDIKGKIALRFSVTPSGTIDEVTILNSTINDKRMEQCIIRRIRNWNDFGICDPSLGNQLYRQSYVFGY